MHPTIRFFGKIIPSYGFTVATGAVLSLLFILFRYRKDHRKADDALYLFVFGGIGAMIGSKLLYLLTVLPDLLSDLHLIKSDFGIFAQKYFTGGFVFYGGLFGAIAGVIIASRYFQVKWYQYAPGLLPAMALFSGFGRIGCFLSGCCYGTQTTLPIGVIYPKGSFAPAGIPLLPVQLMEAGFDFILLIWMWKRGQDESDEVSKLSVGLYLFSYSLVRFILEFFRGDELRGIWFGLSTSQWISVFSIIGVLCYLMYRKHRPSSAARF